MKYRWAIFNADLNPVIGSEQKGIRPVIVISDETFNSVMPVVTILPITSLKLGRQVYPNETFVKAGIGNLAQDSIILAHQIRTISKQRLITTIGSLENPALQKKIHEALKIHLDFD